MGELCLRLRLVFGKAPQHQHMAGQEHTDLIQRIFRRDLAA